MMPKFSNDANPGIEKLFADYPMEANIRCRAFSGDRIRINRVRIESPADVLVWDSVAGHFTRCHILTRSIVSRVRRAIRGS